VARQSGIRVVVVFEYKGVISAQIEQSGPALETHRNAEIDGKALRRSSSAAVLWRSRNHDSLVVERLWNYLAPANKTLGFAETRIFNPRARLLRHCDGTNQYRLLHTASR
jgi:hypothetical protein